MPYVHAHNGTETPFLTKSGKRLLYVWNPGDKSGVDTHAYLDVDNDIILTFEEAMAAIHP